MLTPQGNERSASSGSSVNMNPKLIMTGRVMSALAILFLLVASVTPKLSGAAVATDALRSLGWDLRHTLLIGLIELACVILYVIPRTSVLGAVITTGLLGGAIAAHLRIESPLFSHTLFGAYLALLLWGGLWLRNPSLRAVFPFGNSESRNHD